ncbi:MAG: hypothetical protein ACRDJH_25540 [Thermomicrobiales bacterium]
MRLPIARFAILIGCVVAVSAVGFPHARAQEDGSIDSGGLGLTRAAFEAEYGPGEPVETPPAIYDEVYAYGTEEGMIYVAYEGSKTEADDVVVYLEFAWGGDGATEDEAKAIAERFLPADFTFAGGYFAPPTPDGPTALMTFHYLSDALASVPYGTGTLPPDILVIYFQTLTDVSQPGSQPIAETSVTSVSLLTQIPEG